ncbi:MAG: translocation/assembly module TamB domain-containing protein [Gemmatimonadales bacterium]
MASISGRLLRGLGVLCLSVLLLLLAVVAALQIPAVATWAGRRLVTLAPLQPGYRIEIGRVSGDWLTGLRLREIRLLQGARALAEVEQLRMSYDPRHLLGSATRIESLSVHGARMIARRGPEGWDIAGAFGGSSDTAAGTGVIVVEHLEIDSAQLTAALSPDTLVRVRDLTVRANQVVLGRRVLLELDTLHATIIPPAQAELPLELAAAGALTSETIRLEPFLIRSARTRVAGRVILPRELGAGDRAGELKVRIRAAPLDLADLAALYPPATPEGDLWLDVNASGEGSLITTTLGARLGEATVRLEGNTLLDRDSPALYRLNGELSALDPSDLLRDAPVGSINGKVEVDLQGDELTSLDGSANLRLADSRIGGTPVPSLDLDADVRQGRANVELRGRLAGSRITARGWLRPFDSIPSYRLAGTARSIPGGAELARALAGSAGDPDLSVHFRLAGRGVTREDAALSGRVRLAAVRSPGEPLSLGGAAVQMHEGRLRARPELLVGGGRVTGLLLASLRDPITYELRGGTIERVDLGRLLDDTLAAPVSGHFALAGRGLSPEEANVTLRLRLDSLRYRGRRLDHLVALARLQKERVTVRLNSEVQGGTFALHAAARPFDSPQAFTADSVVAERLDLGSLIGRPDLSGPVTLHGAGSGRWGPGVRAVQGRVTIERSRLGEIEIAGGARFTASAPGGVADSLTGRLEMELLRSRINDAELGPGTIELSLANGEAKGSIRVQGADGQLSADLSGQLTGEVRRFVTDGTLRLEHLARWTGDSGQDGRMEARFALKTLLDSTGVIGVGGTVTAFGGIGGARVRSLHAVLEPDTGSIVVDTLLLRSNVAILDGSGSIGLRENRPGDTLRIVGRAGDINPLARLAGVDSLTLDSARIALTLSGPPGNRRIAAGGFAHRLLYFSTLVEQLDAEVLALVDTAGLGAIAGKVRVQGLASGAVGVREAQFAGRYDSLITLQGDASLEHGVRLRIALEGAARGDTTKLRLGRLGMTEGGRTWELARPAGLALLPDGVEVDDFVLHTAGRQVALDGLLAFRDTSNLTLRLDSVELGSLNEAGLAPVPGRLDGLLHLTGPARAPVLDGQLSLTLHDGEQEDLGQIESALEWTRRGLELTAVAAHQQRGNLTVAGTLPWGFTLAPEDTSAAFSVVRQPGDSIDLSVRADSFEIALLRFFVPDQTARGLRGKLAMDARVRGTPEKPSADGEIRLADLGFEIPAINVDYERGRLAGALDGALLRIDTLLLHTGADRELAAHGEVRLLPLTNPALALDVRLSDFTISNSARLRATASGRAGLGGTFETPVLSGTLRVGPAEFFATGASGIAVEDVELTPEDRLELARHFGPGALARADGREGFLERFRMDLDLRLADQVWFRRREAPELNVEVSGRIRLRQEPGGEMRFYGAVEPVPGRSTLDLYGRTFGLTGGEIILQGPVEQTLIDVTAEFRVATQAGPEDDGVVINVAARGRPDSLALEFSSEPEMPQEDMISYIVTGRPSSASPLVTQSGGGGEGGELVLSQLTEVVSGAVGQELGFDVFQIRQDGTQGLTLVAGRYLSPRFYVSLQQPLELSGQAEQVPGANLGPGFELQYRMSPRLWVNMRGGSLPSGVLLRGRHAY